MHKKYLLFLFAILFTVGYTTPAYTNNLPQTDCNSLAKSTYKMAQFYEEINNLEMAEIFCKIAISQACSENEEGKNLTVDLLTNYASVLSGMGKNEAAIETWINAAGIAAETKNKTQLGLIYHNIGGQFNRLNQYDISLQYFDKSLQNRRYTSDFKGFTLTYLNMAIIYWKTDLDKMKLYIDSAFIYNAKINDPYTKALCLQYEGMYLEKKGFINKALNNYKKALSMAKKNNLSKAQFDILGVLYNVSFSQKKYDDCKYYITSYYELAQQMKNKRHEIQALEELSYLASISKDYKTAYEYLDKYVEINDSLHENALKLQIQKLEKEFDKKEKQQKIESLTYENQQKEKILALNKRTYIAICIVAILLFVIVYLYFLNKRYKQTALLNKINQQKEKEIALALIQGQEQERQRIARELHDGLGGLLSSVKYSIQQDIYTQKIPETILLLDNSIDELRRISHDLTPAALSRYGLTEALKDICKNIENYPPTITLEVDEQIDKLELSFLIKVNIYRIVQEIINNVRKHAGATQLFMQLLYNNKTLLLVAEDNGVGYNPDNNRAKGIGLENIETRIKYLNGTLNIQTGSGEGTCVYIELNL